MNNGTFANFSSTPFFRYIILSVAFHLVLLAVFTVKTLFFPTKELVIRNAIRVDIIDLPDKIKTPKQTSVKTKAPKVKLSPQKTKNKKVKNKAKKINLKKAKDQQNKAFEKLKALQTIDKIQQEIKVASKVEATKKFKGNVIHAGESLTGLDRLDHSKYFYILRSHLQKYFVLPQWLAEADFHAKALVKVDERGFVISKELTERSGNPTFDSRVLEAIDNASPFPPPPIRLKNVIALKGLVFNFPD